MYVGSVESVRQNMWIYDSETDRLINKGRTLQHNMLQHLVHFLKLSQLIVIQKFIFQKLILSLPCTKSMMKSLSMLLITKLEIQTRL